MALPHGTHTMSVSAMAATSGRVWQQGHKHQDSQQTATCGNAFATRQCKVQVSSVLQTPRCESRRVAVFRATPAASDPYSRSFFVTVYYAFACIVVAYMLISLGRRSFPQFLENFSHKLCSCIRSFFALPSPAHPSTKDLLAHFPVSAISNHSTRR